MAIGGFLTPDCPTPRRKRDRSTLRYYKDRSRDHQIFVFPDQLSCRVNNQRRQIGFVSLFNGKDLTGWESLENGSSWKVEDGVLEGRGGGFGKPAVLVSKRRDFKNFRLRAKVRYP